MPKTILPKSDPKPYSLVGRCFHIFGKDKHVQFQGVVRANLGEGLYLIQYFEWMMGEANTLAVVPPSA